MTIAATRGARSAAPKIRNLQKPKPLACPYRVLNLDAHRPPSAPLCVPSTPVAMVNDAGRWCLSQDEACDLAAYSRARGYRVEVVCAVGED